jgi:hypothetical protein
MIGARMGKTGQTWLARAVTRLGQPSPPAQRPRPVSYDRIKHYLMTRSYSFTTDSDGDITGLWDSHRFWFLLLGEDAEIVQVRGRWARALAPQHRRAVLLALNDWNRERIWPKAYLRDEDGRVAIYAEVSADLTPGATDDQLAQVLSCGLGTGVLLFGTLDAQVPNEDTPPPDDIPDN